MEKEQGFWRELMHLISQHTRSHRGRWRRWAARIGHQLVPNLGTIVVVILLLWADGAGAAPWNHPAAAPTWPSATTINYQGRLADSGGTPLEGTVTLQFAFYDSDAEGNLLWGPETHPNVPVSGGLFSVALGSQTGGSVPTDVLAGDIWLEITVDGETLSPRERLGAVPYAMQALTVPDGAIKSRHFAPSWYEDFNLTKISTTSTDLVPTGLSVTFSCETDCTALILHRSLVQHSSANGRVGVAVLADDNIVFRELGVVNRGSPSGTGSNTFESVQGFDFVNLSAGTHTVEVKFKCDTAGTCYYYGDNGGWEHLNVLVFSQQ